MIVKALTKDGLFGTDQYGQHVVRRIIYRKDSAGHVKEYSEYTFAKNVLSTAFGSIVCALCERGWEPTGPSVYDQHLWVLTGEVVHRSCLARHEGFVERAEVYRAIVNAKMRFERLRAVPISYSLRSWYV